MYFFFPPDMKSSQSLFEPRVSAHQAPRSPSSSRSPIQKNHLGSDDFRHEREGRLRMVKEI